MAEEVDAGATNPTEETLAKGDQSKATDTVARLEKLESDYKGLQEAYNKVTGQRDSATTVAQETLGEIARMISGKGDNKNDPAPLNVNQDDIKRLAEEIENGDSGTLARNILAIQERLRGEYQKKVESITQDVENRFAEKDEFYQTHKEEAKLLAEASGVTERQAMAIIRKQQELGGGERTMANSGLSGAERSRDTEEAALSDETVKQLESMLQARGIKTPSLSDAEKQIIAERARKRKTRLKMKGLI